MQLTTKMDYLLDNAMATTTAATDSADLGDTPVLDLTAATVSATANSNAAVDMLHAGMHNQITFEIPSHHDLEHINTLHTFNTLLQRIGNVAYDTVASSLHGSEAASQRALGVDAAGQHITSEQISKSAVLNLADLKGSSGSIGGGFLERFFEGADMHAIINYLWIGVVTSLVILSVIFIVFSCYFYRKFREWKKCNKDIRNHLSNDMYPGGHLVLSDQLMGVHPQHPAAVALDAAYCQVESPPCYTIATGLPTYDEALYHHQHFTYGMKFIYPTLAAVHTHSAVTDYGNNNNNNNNVITDWRKDADAFKEASSGTIQKLSKLQKEDQEQNQEQKQQQQKCQQQQQQLQMKQKSYETMEALSATYDAAAELHGLNLLTGVSVATPLLHVPHDNSEVITICLDDMTPAALLYTSSKAANATQQQFDDDEADEFCSAVTIA